MRKLIAVVVLTASYLALSGVASGFVVPQCYPHCPFVR